MFSSVSKLNGNHPDLEQFGFSSDRGGAHLARTMMFHDLETVLGPNATIESVAEVVLAVEADNCLGKRSTQARKLASRHLQKLYGFSSVEAVYRGMAFLWAREEDGRVLLALLCAYVRDAVLRSSSPFIRELAPGERFHRKDLEEFIDELQLDRFSKATLKSTAQNLAGTWTQSGHLVGRVKKFRQFVEATPGSVSFALLLGFIAGERGELLFESEYVKLLDCSATKAIELAERASRQGWINLKRVGSIVEVTFPRLLTSEEMELVREQD